LGQQRSTLRFTDAVDSGQWVVVNLAKGKLREHAHTLGNLVFARLQFDILARANVAEHRRRLVTVFADEVQHLAENDLTTLLAEGRKFRVSLVTGHQFWEQLPRESRGAVLSAGAHVFFRLSSADAAALGSELSVAAKHRYHRELTQLARGRAIAGIGGAPPVAFTVPALPKVTTRSEDIEDLRSESVGRYARPRPDIEAEIRSRRQTPDAPVLPATHTHDPHEGQRDW
jgi:hypothetical protein